MRNGFQFQYSKEKNKTLMNKSLYGGKNSYIEDVAVQIMKNEFILRVENCIYFLIQVALLYNSRMARKTISSLKGFPIICTPIGEPIDSLVD